MARVAGVDIPDNKRLDFSLRRIYGIGPLISQQIAQKAGIEGNPRVQELTEEQLTRIREIVDKEYMVEGDLRRENSISIKRLIDLACYRGSRHKKKLPVRGQRTHCNARTRKGKAIAIAGKKLTPLKK